MCWEDYPVWTKLFWLSHCGVSGFVSAASFLQDNQQQTWLCPAARLTAPWCSARGCFLAPSSPQHISRWKSQYILLTYSNYSWRENISHLTRLTKTLTVLYIIECVYFNKAIHYKVRNQIVKRKYSRVLLGCFGISCRKSFSLSQAPLQHCPECGSEPGPFLRVSFHDMPSSYIIPSLFSRQQSW